MVFNVNNNGDPFKLPKIKLDFSQGSVESGNPLSIFNKEKNKESEFFPADFNLLEIKKEETDTTVSYTRNGLKTIFYKRENSDVPESIKYESEYFEDLKYYQIFYDEVGNPIRREEIFKDDNELATKEILYSKEKPNQPVYQKEVFKEGEEFLTRETFYDELGCATVKTLCANGDIIIKKQLPDKTETPEIIVPNESFGVDGVDIFTKNEKGELVKSGNIFDNQFGINLDDLHLPKIKDLTREELSNYPKNAPIILEKELPRGRVVQEVGAYRNGKFISYSLNKDKKVEENFYSIGLSSADLRLEHSKCGSVTTEYVYSGDEVTAQSLNDGMPFYYITTDARGNKTKTFAYEKYPYSRVKVNKKGEETLEFFNQLTKKWSKEYPGQPVFISYSGSAGRSPASLEKFKEMPLGTKVKIEFNKSTVPYDVDIKLIEAEYRELTDTNNVTRRYYVREYDCKGSGEPCIEIFEIKEDFSAGRRFYSGPK